MLLQVGFCQERVFLEGFDPLPFCFPVPHFAYFRQYICLWLLNIQQQLLDVHPNAGALQALDPEVHW